MKTILPWGVPLLVIGWPQKRQLRLFRTDRSAQQLLARFAKQEEPWS